TAACSDRASVSMVGPTGVVLVLKTRACSWRVATLLQPRAAAERVATECIVALSKIDEQQHVGSTRGRQRDGRLTGSSAAVTNPSRGPRASGRTGSRA